MRFVLDADVVLCLRALDVDRAWIAAAAGDGPVVLCSFIARHELSTIASDVATLEGDGLVEVHAVEIRSPAGRRWRELVRSGVHKGEAEAIAWCAESPAMDPLFVSIDGGARREATRQRIVAADLMGFAVELVERQRLDRADVERVLSIWDDRSQQLGRPADYTTFADTYGRRLAKP